MNNVYTAARGDFFALLGVFDDKNTDVKVERKSCLYVSTPQKGVRLFCFAPHPSLLPYLCWQKWNMRKTNTFWWSVTARYPDKQMMLFVVLLIFRASPVLSNCSPPWQHNFHTSAPPPPSCNPAWNAALLSFSPKHSTSVALPCKTHSVQKLMNSQWWVQGYKFERN